MKGALRRSCNLSTSPLEHPLNHCVLYPPSVAFLYCRHSLLPNRHHPVVSNEYRNGLTMESAWFGNRDYNSQFFVPAAVEFVKQFEGGVEGVRKKNLNSVVRMGEMLVKAWGTHLGAPPELCSAMAMVGLPDSSKISSKKDAIDLRNCLRKDFGVEVLIYHRPQIAKTEFDVTYLKSQKIPASSPHKMSCALLCRQ